MRQLAFLRMFILVAMSIYANDNRRHIHVFYKGKRHQHSLAKIWIESNGQQCVEIAESSLSAKDNEMLVAAINRHWEFINEQVTRAFNGEKTISIDIEKWEDLIMCKMKDVSVGIKDMDFKTYRGKMVVRLTDGRTIIVPVSFFPDIKQMPVKEREKWMVLDDQYFTFENMTRVYSVLDLLKVA